MTSIIGAARPLLAVPPHTPERPAHPPPASPADVVTGPAPIAPNPSLRIEPTLGLVVFEVRDGGGEVTRSVPTERELRAYRTAALRGEDKPLPAEGDQIRNPPGGSPSSANALEVAEEGAPKAPADSPARLIR